jgi:hypothetical protein
MFLSVESILYWALDDFNRVILVFTSVCFLSGLVSRFFPQSINCQKFFSFTFLTESPLSTVTLFYIWFWFTAHCDLGNALQCRDDMLSIHDTLWLTSHNLKHLALFRSVASVGNIMEHESHEWPYVSWCSVITHSYEWQCVGWSLI